MIAMKLLGKLEKLCGGDAIESRWYELPLYEYTLQRECTHETAIGHGYEWRTGDVVVYRATDNGWARATVYPFTSDNMAMKSVVGTAEGFEDVKTVSGVIDVDETQIGTTHWDIRVDVAAGTVTNVVQSESRF
jgi:hypothetical protein